MCPFCGACKLHPRLTLKWTIIRMLSDNVKYEILKVCAVMDPISDTKKLIPNGTHAGRELLSMLEGIVELNQFEVDGQVTKTNKLKGITKITLSLDELNNSNNLKDGRPSNELLTYHVTSNEDFTRFEPQTPQYRKLKNREFTLFYPRMLCHVFWSQVEYQIVCFIS